jgi:hypothetical protein
VVEPQPGAVAPWLEDVAGLPGARWPVSRLAGFAERLGRAQAGWAGRLGMLTLVASWGRLALGEPTV